MADDIVTIINAQLAICQASPCDCTCPILIKAADEIERLREQVQYRDDVIAMLRREVSVLCDELRLAGEEARCD